ncbi:GntR family transcriptional regulator [Burkholderia cenocepacia]|uniref:GntR family transcriptional regulator n=1 Tax=Burkholderia cenocepacia TaxID=95486 RepID=UPI0026537CD0|nr:GntR family transcriptional regulator [Burkholderia cenocepacia]MDN7631587.1 GntR family transcriptional regulator [Burkholderia cenocepacia]
MSTPTPLQARIRDQIRLLAHDMEAGVRLNEAELANELGVSRTPVRNVLFQLVEEGWLDYEQNKGFRLKEAPVHPESETDEQSLLDERVMRDMALGNLRNVQSERALMQRYAVPNGTLRSTLRRLMRDGLVGPSPGRGWIFTNVDPAALSDGYRFRQIIEPAAILADAYEIDTRALELLDRAHAEAIERITDFDRRYLFELDARFHRLVAQGAKTSGLVEAIDKQNNIRRANEYIGYSRQERIVDSMKEHRRIIAALLANDRQLAAALMRVHLSVSMHETFEHINEDLELVRSGKINISSDQT